MDSGFTEERGDGYSVVQNEKLGSKLAGTFDDFPPGHRMHFFTRVL